MPIVCEPQPFYSYNGLVFGKIVYKKNIYTRNYNTPNYIYITTNIHVVPLSIFRKSKKRFNAMIPIHSNQSRFKCILNKSINRAILKLFNDYVLFNCNVY